jgi:hypothetical protein
MRRHIVHTRPSRWAIASRNLPYDRDARFSLYAHAGIPDYWVLDLENRLD